MSSGRGLPASHPPNIQLPTEVSEPLDGSQDDALATTRRQCQGHLAVVTPRAIDATATNNTACGQLAQQG